MATEGDGDLGGFTDDIPEIDGFEAFCDDCVSITRITEHFCAKCHAYLCVDCVIFHFKRAHKVFHKVFRDEARKTAFPWYWGICKGCTRCEGKDRVVEAKHYCTSCHEFYCDECVQIHSEISTLKTHKVLGEEGRQDWGQHQGSVGPGCLEHDGQTLSMYCEDHDVVCCPVCVSLDHKNCNHMKYIPKIAKGIFQSQDLDVLTNNLKALRTKMECIIQEGDDIKSSLDLSRQTCLQTIADFCERVRTILDKLEERAIKDMDILLKKNQDAVEQVQKACNNVIGKIERQEMRLGNTNNITEQQMFFVIREIKQEVLIAQAMAQDVPALSEQNALTFEVDKKLDKSMEDLQRIGIAKPCHSPRKESQADIGASRIY